MFFKTHTTKVRPPALVTEKGGRPFAASWFGVGGLVWSATDSWVGRFMFSSLQLCYAPAKKNEHFEFPKKWMAKTDSHGFFHVFPVRGPFRKRFQPLVFWGCS